MVERLEKKWHIAIRDDSFWNPRTQRMVKCYKIYTADGCPWQNGLSWKGLLAEIRNHGELFLKIAGVAN